MSSSTWPSPSVDVSSCEAVSYVIIISILQKKLRLREAGRLAQGLRGGRAGT